METREIVGLCLLSLAFISTMVALFYNRGSGGGSTRGGGTFSRQYEWEMETVDPLKIREYLEELSKEPHMAGLDRDEALAEWIAEGWRSLGLDYVKVQTYSMLLDYPNSADPNLIRLFDANGDVIFTSHYKEEGVDDPNFVHAFNAYSKPGTVEGVPLYVNYGSVEDFQYLKDNYNVDFTGKICLARYGQIFRGNKADNGARFGCAGVIIFSDPAEAAQEGVEPEHVYPNSFWLPGTGVQRGSLSLSDGDPLTPNWPSLEHAYRLDMEERQTALPSIVVQPIGYDDAKEILLKMGGQEAPQDWQGKIPGVTYMIGGEFSADYQGAKLELSVHNIMEERGSSNVIGILYGAEEPDRYVMLGNHRDAWGFGAVDPSSGTAQMMEVVRVLTEKVKQGWRPRRTIMFLSWGAEEFSLCGSREFVEEYQVQLEDRGVAYINTDICMSGQILEPAASPTLAHLYKEAVKDIYSPTGEGSYYDFWREYEGVPEGEEFNPAVVTSPGAGSDHATFIYLAGVPVMDLSFGPDRKKYPNIGGYPLYHTGYETFDLVDKIYDPEFNMFRACAQLNLRLGLEMADAELLPLRLAGYADVMEAAMQELEKNGVIAQLTGLGVDTQYLNQSVYQFRGAVEEYEAHVADMDRTNPLVLRTLNDQLRGFEKSFLLNPSLPDRPQYRHAVIAPSLFDAYGGSAFPGIGDLLYGIDDPSLSEDDRRLRVKKLKRHVSDLMILVQRAGKFLQPVSLL